MATASELLDQWVSTFSESKWEEGQRLWAAGGRSEEIGTGRTFGPEEGVAVSKEWTAAFPDARGTVENRIAAGDQVAGEVVWTGTNTGSLNRMPPTGKRVQVRAAVVLRAEGGKIAHLRHYLDVAGLMQQLGAAPG